jgi:hypothetical protein
MDKLEGVGVVLGADHRCLPDEAWEEIADPGDLALVAQIPSLAAPGSRDPGAFS